MEKKDITGVTIGTKGQTFEQDEKVMIRRLGDGWEYRAKISGVAIDGGGAEVKIMICEIIDPLPGPYSFTHIIMPEVCIDKESWDD